MPGPLPGQTVTAGTIFGLSEYGTSLYGIGVPPEYLVEPMTAASDSYTSVLVTWHAPSGIIFRYRLLRNRYGFPVNENDGDIIYDTTAYPGDSYTDLAVSPGTYHYYAFYVLVDIGDNIWVRSGFAGCLAIQDYGSGQWLLDLLPEYFTTIPETGAALTDDAAGNSQLQLFLSVLGWTLDYLRTQYGTYADHLNDARFIPLDDLWHLAQQVGVNFSPDVPAYTVRKAVENFAHVAGQHGTVQGIAEEIALRTGYGADVHMGPNILLDDDQAQILSPVFLQYQTSRCYQIDECVWVPYSGRHWWWFHNGDGWWFRSLQNNNCTTPPAGGTSNAWWQALYDSDDFLGTQGNISTSNPSTWELLDTAATNYIPAAGSCIQGLGVQAPAPVNSGANANAWNTLRFYNRQSGARTFWLRSVSRRHIDLGQIPDPSFELGTTIAPPNQVLNKTWVPRSWPKVTVIDWRGGSQPVSVPAYWTPVNATVSREDTTAHTGSWAMQVTPTGTATPVAAPSAVQYPDASFETPTLTGWAGTNCTISQSTAQAHTGKFSLQVAPSFTVTTKYTSGSPSGNIFTLAGSPYVTGPQITAIPGASDTVTVQALGTQVPAGAAAMPSLIPGIIYYDLNGNVLQTSEGASVLLTGSWGALTCTATAPAGAAAKALLVTSDPAQAANADNWYLDDVAWTWTVSETWAAVQLNSPWISCPPATACTGSASYDALSGGSSIQAELVFYDQAGNVLASSSGSPVTGTANTWVNPSASGTSPAGTQYAALNLDITSPVSSALIDDTTITPGLTYSTQPDPLNAVRDGIPVPWVINGEEWDPARRYVINDITQYGGQPFQALRASTGSVPPANNVATTDWAPLSQNHRIRLCLSGYTSQNLTASGTYSYAATPLIEWYDQQGNFITRIIARSAAGNGTVSQPGSMAFDSFTTQSIIASAGSAAGTASPGPWTAAFWNNTSLSGTPALTRTDPSLSFTWAGTAPGPGVAAAGWSASWITTYTAPAAGSYTFGMQSGQGGWRLIIAGTTVIDNWAAQSTAALTAAVTLTAGQVITIEADYWMPAQAQSAYTTSSETMGTVTTAAAYVQHPPGRAWFLQSAGSQASAPLPITPGEILQLAGTITSTDDDAVPYLSVTWLTQSMVPAGTQSITFPAPGTTTLAQSLTAPGGTSYAAVTLTVSAPAEIFALSPPDLAVTWTGITITAQQLTAAADSLTFSPVIIPAVLAGAAQLSTGLAGRLTDDEQSNWTVPAGAWTAGGYAGGTAWPSNPAVQNIAILTTQPANTSLGLTYRSAPQGGTWAGIVFRYASTSSYWRADQVQLGYVSGGVYTLAGLHAQAFRPGDRMTVVLNGTSITVQRNGVTVNSTTSSFNQSAASHGIISDITASVTGPPSDPLRKHRGPVRGRLRTQSLRGRGGSSAQPAAAMPADPADPMRKDDQINPRPLPLHVFQRHASPGGTSRGGRH